MLDIIRAGGQVQFPPGFDPNAYPGLGEATGDEPSLRQATPAEQAASQTRMNTMSIDFESDEDETPQIDFEADEPETENARALAEHRWRVARRNLVANQPLPETQPMRLANDPGIQPLESYKVPGPDGQMVEAPWRRRFENLQRGIVRGAATIADLGNNVIEAGLAAHRGDQEEADLRNEEFMHTGKEMVRGALQTPLAFLGANVGMIDPTGKVGPLLDEQGIGPKTYTDMMEKDPAGTVLNTVGAPGVGMFLKGAPKGAPLERGLSAGDIAADARLKTAKAGVDTAMEHLASLDLKESVRKGQEAARKAAYEAKGEPAVPEPSPDLLNYDETQAQHAQFQTDLTKDTAYPVSDRTPNIPSEQFKNWSMEKGFDQDMLTTKEWGEWLDQRDNNRGFNLTEGEVDTLAKAAKEKLAAEAKPTKGKKAKSNPTPPPTEEIGATEADFPTKLRKKKAQTASFLGTQELYDLAVHFAGKLPEYTKWVGEMIKHVGQIGAARLRALYDGALRVLQFSKERKAAVVERRANPELRAAVTQQVENYRLANQTYLQAVQAIADAKNAGLISGAEESILLREAGSQYSKNAVHGVEPTPEPTGGEYTSQDMADMTQRAGKLLEEPPPFSPQAPAIDPYLAATVRDFQASGVYDRNALEKLVLNLGGDPEVYLPPVVKGKKGLTLSTLGGQELYERTVHLARSMGRAVREAGASFDAWASHVRGQAAESGIDLTDAQLRDAWEAGRPDPIAAQAQTDGAPPEVAARAAAETHGFLGELVRFTRPKLWDAIMSVVPEVGERAVNLIQAKHTAALMAKHDFDALFDIFKHGVNKTAAKAREAKFIEILWDYRARSLEQKAANIAAQRAALEGELATLTPADGLRRLQLEAELEELTVPPEHNVPSLTPQQRIAYMEDPQIAAAVDWWDKNIRPRIARESANANIRTRLTAEGGPDLYARMQWRRETGRLPGKTTAFRGRTKSKSALEATGVAPENFELPTDLEQILYDTYEQRVTPAAHRRLNEAMAEPGVKEIPEAIEAYELATRKQPDFLDNKALQAVQAAGTVPTLIMPAEAVAHSIGIVGTASRIRWGKSLPVEAFETLGGVWAKQAIALKRAMTLGGPELTAALERWNRVGLFRAHGMTRLMADKSLFQKATDIPGLRIPKKIAFGHTGYTAWALKGLESRYRIAMAEAIKDMDPSLTDAQVSLHVNNVAGTYVSKLAPQMARVTAPLTAFSRARTALPKSAVNYMIGRDATGRFSKLQLANAAWSTALSTVILTKMFDKDHRWPWQIPGWSPRRPVVFTLEDGRRVEIPIHVIANPIGRAMQTTGLNNSIESYLKGNRSVYGLGAEAARGLYNYGASFLGPHATSAMIATTGYTPYMTTQGLYSPEIATMTGAEFSPGKARARAIGEQWFPLFSRFSDNLPEQYGGEAGREAHPTDPVWNFAFHVGEAFGVAPTMRAAGFETQAKRGMQPLTESEFRDAFYQTLGEARNIDPGHRTQWVLSRIEHNFSDAIVMTQKGPMPARIAAMDLLKLVNTAPKRDTMKGVLNEINAP